MIYRSLNVLWLYFILFSHLSKAFNRTIELNLANIGPSCEKNLKNFANYTSEFTACALTNSRPAQFCEKCVNFYAMANQSINVINSLKEVKRVVVVTSEEAYPTHLP